MPTAILDIEASDLPSVVSLDPKYGRAFVLFRWHGVPVGHAVLPVRHSELSRAALSDAVLRHGAATILQRELTHHVGWDDHGLNDLPLATVAVCTRDRPEDLVNCLAALDRLPDDGQEVLVVDSASKDAATIREIVARHRRARCIRLELPGLDRARNAALREARHPIVAFTDDDAAPDPNWLRGLLRNFVHPRTLCVTGLTLPAELETQAQEVFENTNGFARGYTRAAHDGSGVNPFEAARVGAGVNMALRRSVLDLIGPFDDALDAGTPTRSGGDHDMFVRILRAGYVIVYDPVALTWHRHRRTWEELRATVRGYGSGVLAYATAHTLRGEPGAGLLGLRWMIWQIADFLNGILGAQTQLPRDLALAQLAGCFEGPGAYFRSRRALNRTRQLGADAQ